VAVVILHDEVASCSSDGSTAAGSRYAANSSSNTFASWPLLPASGGHVRLASQYPKHCTGAHFSVCGPARKRQCTALIARYRDGKAVARNELTSVQFMIHSFEALINDRSLCGGLQE
jgi:hypothetical protein